MPDDGSRRSSLCAVQIEEVRRREARSAARHLVHVFRPVSLTRIGCQPLAAARSADGIACPLDIPSDRYFGYNPDDKYFSVGTGSGKAKAADARCRAAGRFDLQYRLAVIGRTGESGPGNRYRAVAIVVIYDDTVIAIPKLRVAVYHLAESHGQSQFLGGIGFGCRIRSCRIDGFGFLGIGVTLCGVQGVGGRIGPVQGYGRSESNAARSVPCYITTCYLSRTVVVEFPFRAIGKRTVRTQIDTVLIYLCGINRPPADGSPYKRTG